MNTRDQARVISFKAASFFVSLESSILGEAVSEAASMATMLEGTYQDEKAQALIKESFEYLAKELRLNMLLLASDVVGGCYIPFRRIYDWLSR